MKKLVKIFSILIVFIFGCSAGNTQDVNNGISGSKILTQINKGKIIFIQNKIITDELDFSKVDNSFIFSSGQKISVIEVPVTFINCVFLKPVKAVGTDGKLTITCQFEQNLTFENCDFRAETDFSNIVVKGQTNFTGSKFRENAQFANVAFYGKNHYFTSVSAEKAFYMQDALINGNLDFFKAKTGGKFSVQGIHVSGTAVFNSIECGAKSDFSLAVFDMGLLMNYAIFNGEFRMNDVRSAGRIDMSSIKFNAAGWMTNCEFRSKVLMNKILVSQSLDLSGTIFAQGKPELEETLPETIEKIVF